MGRKRTHTLFAKSRAWSYKTKYIKNTRVKLFPLQWIGTQDGKPEFQWPPSIAKSLEVSALFPLCSLAKSPSTSDLGCSPFVRTCLVDQSFANEMLQLCRTKNCFWPEWACSRRITSLVISSSVSMTEVTRSICGLADSRSQKFPFTPCNSYV